MKKNKDLSIHEKAIRLIEGGVVEISGHFVVAVEEKELVPCVVCKMDSACDMDMKDLCCECEEITRKRYMLRFTYERNNK